MERVQRTEGSNRVNQERSLSPAARTGLVLGGVAYFVASVALEKMQVIKPTNGMIWRASASLMIMSGVANSYKCAVLFGLFETAMGALEATGHYESVFKISNKSI